MPCEALFPGRTDDDLGAGLRIPGECNVPKALLNDLTDKMAARATPKRFSPLAELDRA